eukprot:6490777-Amphidinium_carterae.1
MDTWLSALLRLGTVSGLVCSSIIQLMTDTWDIGGCAWSRRAVFLSIAHHSSGTCVDHAHVWCDLNSSYNIAPGWCLARFRINSWQCLQVNQPLRTYIWLASCATF